METGAAHGSSADFFGDGGFGEGAEGASQLEPQSSGSFSTAFSPDISVGSGGSSSKSSNVCVDGAALLAPSFFAPNFEVVAPFRAPITPLKGAAATGVPVIGLKRGAGATGVFAVAGEGDSGAAPLACAEEGTATGVTGGGAAFGVGVTAAGGAPGLERARPKPTPGLGFGLLIEASRSAHALFRPDLAAVGVAGAATGVNGFSGFAALRVGVIAAVIEGTTAGVAEAAAVIAEATGNRGGGGGIA